MSASLSHNFLADLAQVYTSLTTPAFSDAFLSDLAKINATLPDESELDLVWLAERFTEWRQSTSEFVRTRLLNLSDDDPLRCPVSLFRTMDLGRLETAHTRTLAWLLDPRKTNEHGFGDVLLRAILGRLAGQSKFDELAIDRFHSEFPIQGSGSRGRLDLLAEGSWITSGVQVAWTMVIEAKVDAFESEGQLGKYDDWLKIHAPNRELYRVFLTPNGRITDSSNAEWTPLSFLELVRIFRAVYGGLRNAPGFHFLRFYLAGVLQDVCRFPRAIEDASDPYSVASYLKTVDEAQSEGISHDAAR